MLRSWKLGNAFGIGIYVHWSFLLLLAFVYFMTRSGGKMVALFSLALVLSIFVCVVLHELAHWALHDQPDLPNHGSTFARLVLDATADPQLVLKAAMAAGPVTEFAVRRRTLSEVFREEVSSRSGPRPLRAERARVQEAGA